MTLAEMYVEIPRIRKEFRDALNRTNGDVARSCVGAFQNCCSDFEEDCVRENLVEEFNDYVISCMRRTA